MSFKSDMYSLGKIIIELVTGGKEILNNSNTVRGFYLAMQTIFFVEIS